MSESLHQKLGLDEFSTKSGNLCRSMVAEFIGVFFLNLFGCMACTHANGDLVLISFAFGLAIFMAAMAIGHISGHLNPAVTIGLMAAGKVKLVRSILYIIAQCLGATAGTAALQVLISGSSKAVGIGHTNLSAGTDVYQGIGFEFFLGFILVMCVLGVCDDNKSDHRFVGPLAIGLTVTLGHLGAVSYTGASMNPARTFGTAFVSGVWENHFVYWVGPICGGLAASLLYSLLFVAPEPENRSDRYHVVGDEREMKTLNAKQESA